MPKIRPADHPILTGSGYLPPHGAAVAGRSRIAVGAAGHLTQFGANLVTLQPGAWSSQHHWHSAEDELVIMVSGALVLVEYDGETPMMPAYIATFKAGTANGHHLQNRSDAPATFLAVGCDRPETDECQYPEIDMFWSAATGFTAKPQG